MNIRDYLQDNIVFLDGGMGTLLQEHGLKPGELPERWNISHSDFIVELHKAYFEAGANVVCTNTFGANSEKYSKEELQMLISAAVENAMKARKLSGGQHDKFIALDVGSIGKLLKPFGVLEFETAVGIFSETMKIGAECGVDLIFIETMNDCYETKAALLAAKESTSLPVFVSNAYGADGRLMSGASPAAMVAMLEGMGADAIGANCSLGPSQLKSVVDEYLRLASVPVLLKPNAGLPRVLDGKTVFDVMPDEFSDIMAEYIKTGVRLAGGCCGTSPEYIASLTSKAVGIAPVHISKKTNTVISSYTDAVDFTDVPILIGERINPTGKKKLKEALKTGDLDYILNAGLSQQEKGVHVLDVNVGIPEIDETAVLREVCCELQAIINLPLQLDTANPEAMEAALRCYNGKAMINSVNGKQESMSRIFPLVKKYGGVVVCLTLDENGIPETAEGRVAIAQRIIDTATEYGIEKKDLIFDTLAMTVSADTKAALTTITALDIIKNKLHCHTSLGISNISFGLPCREAITASFFTTALENGLSAAIMNPLSSEIMKAYYSYRVLHGLDENCSDYIANIEKYSVVQQSTEPTMRGAVNGTELPPLQRAIIKGLKEQAAVLTSEKLETVNPIDIVNGDIIPALDNVGQGFEKKLVYLPELLMSAEAAQSAFERIKLALKQGSATEVSTGSFIIATVHGDIHDIGKNIVKLLLENYGFEVTDLGKDVPATVIVENVKMYHAPLVGLSALMTTTVPAMQETINLLRNETPWVKICVGGAVLTEEFAKDIGADYFGRDAMATVRYALKVMDEQKRI